MNKNEQIKFERLASLFHHELNDANDVRHIQDEPGINGDADFRAVKKIYEARDLVSLAGKITHRAIVWRKIHQRIHRRNPSTTMIRWRYAAAITTVALILGFAVLQTVRHNFSEMDQLISIAAPANDIKKLVLSDGTEVYLNSGSTFNYSTHFGKTNRYVEVEGEAFFKVFKDNMHPFTVALGHSNVVVHGTTFNVKDYATDTRSEVVLIEGSVEFINSETNIFIKPGERITENKATNQLVVDKVDTEKYLAWIGRKAYFDNKTLLELADLLEKWYDVDFEFENKDAQSYTFTGVINREQTLDYTLKIIEMTNKVKFVKKGGKMLITN